MAYLSSWKPVGSLQAYFDKENDDLVKAKANIHTKPRSKSSSGDDSPKEMSDAKLGGDANDSVIGDVIEYDRYFLLVSAPVYDAAGGLFSDQTARELQFDYIKKKHMGVKDAPDLNPESRVSCLSWTDMRNEVIHFFAKYAQKAFNAIIIFNGHGSSSGHLVFGGDLEPMVTVKDVCECVIDLMNERKLSRHGYKLPPRVELVFLQCYSYVGQADVTLDDLNVYMYTSPLQPTSEYGVRKVVQDGELVILASRHYALAQYIDDFNNQHCAD